MRRFILVAAFVLMSATTSFAGEVPFPGRVPPPPPPPSGVVTFDDTALDETRSGSDERSGEVTEFIKSILSELGIIF